VFDWQLAGRQAQFIGSEPAARWTWQEGVKPKLLGHADGASQAPAVVIRSRCRAGMTDGGRAARFGFGTFDEVHFRRIR